MKKRLFPQATLLILCCLLTLTRADAIPSPDNANAVRFRTGENIIARDQLDSACVFFASWQNEDAVNPWAELGLGHSLSLLSPQSSTGPQWLSKARKHPETEAMALYFLGCHYKALGFDGSRRALQYFSKSLKSDPTHLPSYLAMAEIRDSQALYNDAGVKILGEALLNVPFNINLYRLFLEKAYFDDHIKTGLRYLDELHRQHPDNLHYRLDMANFQMLRGNLAEAGRLLSGMPQDLPEQHRFQALYFKSILAFLNEENNQQDLYWQAVSAISQAADLKMLVQDLRYVMKPGEWDLLSQEPLNAQEFIAAFWQRRDPFPLTALSERLPRYYRQLYQARRHCRRFGSMRGRPQAFGAMDIDDMGQVLLRHGQPDDRITDNIADMRSRTVPRRNSTFVYYGRHGRPERHYHFAYKSHKGRGWILTPVPPSIRQRELLGGEYASLAALDFRNVYLQCAQPGTKERVILELADGRSRMGSHSKAAVLTGLPDMVYALAAESDGEQSFKAFAMPYQACLFKNKSGQYRLEYYHSLSGRSLEPDPQADSPALRLNYYIAFRDVNNRLIKELRFARQIAVPTGRTDWADGQVTAMETLELPAGMYQIDIHVQDATSEQAALVRLPVDTDRIGDQALCLSDVILSSQLSSGNEKSNTPYGGWQLTPHMFTPYRNNEAVGLYADIYNLTLDGSGKSRYRVAWTLKTADGRTLRRQGGLGNFLKSLVTPSSGVVASQADFQGQSRRDRLALNLDLNQTQMGSYLIEIEVTDINSGQKTVSSVPLELDKTL